jgi:hypothetical protein
VTTPASQIRSYQVTIPAGTAQDAPYTADITFPAYQVNALRWKVPPGPSGLMGWQLQVAGQPVIPRVAGSWIVADNESDTWTLTGYPDQGQWQLAGYNTDIYDHTVYLDFLLDPVVSQQPSQLPGSPAIAALTSQTATTEQPPQLLSDQAIAALTSGAAL